VDVAVVVLASTSSEGHDRPRNLTLGQSDLVDSIASVKPSSTVVITVSPGPYVAPWADSVAAIVDFGLSGEQEGNAVADVLLGDVTPSGKLPHTLPLTANDMNWTERQYPGIPPLPNASISPCTEIPRGLSNFSRCAPTVAYYDERTLFGYRFYEAHDTRPRFPFGHGLSYAAFQYSSLTISGRNITLTVKNVALPAIHTGAEVVQVYVTYPGEGAVAQLRGFHKTQDLRPGQVEVITFSDLNDDRWLSVWNSTIHEWSLVQGTHKIQVGSSSEDIRATAELSV